jgi:hypothetical protein
MLKNLNYKHLYIGLTLYLIIFFYATAPFACGRQVVTLSWSPPTINSDGTIVTDLAGYIIYYWREYDDYAQGFDIGNVTTYQLEVVNERTYYFAVTAYDTSGNESEYSNMAIKYFSD